MVPQDAASQQKVPQDDNGEENPTGRRVTDCRTDNGDDSPTCRRVTRALQALRDLAPDDEKDDYDCSTLLNQGAERIDKALAMPSVILAAALARKMQALSTPEVMKWASEQGLIRTQTISFFPLRRSEVHVVTTCIIKPQGVPALQRSYELIERHGLTFLPLDIFDWAPQTHDVFVRDKFFDKAAEKLTEMGLVDLLVPMILYKGRGLLLKYHMPQPELKQGTKNPQSSEHSVWTISVTDNRPPEVLKVGMRDSRVLIVPWNPSDKEVCIQAEQFEGDWLATKNQDFHCCHFVLESDGAGAPGSA